MGTLRAVFEVRRGRILASTLFFGVCFCLALVLLAGLPVMAHDPKTKRPIVIYAVFGPFMLAWVGLNFYLVLKGRRNLGMRVEADHEGLTIHHRGVVEVCPWNEIETVWHKAESTYGGFGDWLGTYLEGSGCVYTIRRQRDGARFVFNALLRNIEVLGRIIRVQTVPRMKYSALDAIRMGETVRFGMLAIGPDGLSKGNKFLPWAEVGDVRLENSCVFVRKSNGRLAWRGVAMGRVPNLYAYLAVVWFSHLVDPLDHSRPVLGPLDLD
ncbi:MAG: DUF6585 family protein [Isosphaeraceae bacterium]